MPRKGYRPSSFNTIGLDELGASNASPQLVARGGENPDLLYRVRVSVFGTSNKFAYFAFVPNVLQSAGLDAISNLENVFKVAVGSQETFYITDTQALYGIGDVAGLSVSVHVTDLSE